MRKPLIITALIAAMASALTSCNQKQEESYADIANFEISETYKTAWASYLHVNDSTFGEDVPIYSQAAISIQWPNKYGNNDISCLQDSLIANVFGYTGVSIDQAISDYIAQPQGYGDFELLKVDDPNPEGVTLLQSVRVHTVGFCERYIVYKITEFEDNGGAHPLYSSKFLNYDIRNNKVLEFSDIFVAGSEQVLLDAITAQLLDMYFATNLEELEENSGIFTDQIYLTDNIYITGSEIVFFYNPYDIAPWAVGSIEVPLQEYDLEEILTPQARALFWWNDTQIAED